MNVLLYHDFFYAYFESKGKVLPTTQDQTRINIVQNPNNVIVYSNQYLQHLEVTFDTSNKFYDDFSTFMVEVMDSSVKGKLVPSPLNSRTIEEEYVALSNSISNELCFFISENALTTVPKLAAISLISKPNYHWFICTLAANHNITLYYHDFKTDVQIECFFNDIFLSQNMIDRIYYFDRYYENSAEHKLFHEIKRCNYCFSIYTYTQGKSSTLLSKSQNAFKLAFGVNCEVLFTKTKGLTHQRKLMFNNIIVISDHDFAQLKVTNKNWSIAINYSKEHFNRSISDTSAYSKFVN